MKWRHQYDQEENERVSLATASGDFPPTLTQKQFAKDADLNELVKRFGLDKQPIPPAVLDPAYYGEVPADLDLSWAMRTVRDAQERFDALPAPIRERFANDPRQLWDFVNDSANADEAVALGLLKRAETALETPNGAQPTTDTGSASNAGPTGS